MLGGRSVHNRRAAVRNRAARLPKMPWVNEKLLRLLLVVVGLGALGALGWRIYDYWRHEDAFFPVVDVRQLQKAAGTGPRVDPGHLLPFPEYAVLETLNVTGKEKVVDAPPVPPPPPPPRLSPRDLQLVYIQYTGPSSASNAAWIHPSDETASDDHIPGNLYASGERIPIRSKPKLDVRVKEVKAESVIVGFGAGDDAGEIELNMATHVLPQNAVGPLLGTGGRSTTSRPKVRGS